MTRTMTAWIGAAALAVASTTLPVGAQSGAPSATDKLTINGWALNMSNTATGANQTIQIMKKNSIELENYSSEPVRLNNLTLEVRK